MTSSPRRVRAATVPFMGVVFGVVLGAVTGCDEAPAPLMPQSADGPAFHHSAVESPEVQKWLAGLRAATASYQRIEAALDAEYDIVFQDACFEMPGVGGMGFHYVNGGLVDGTVEEFAPEALMYEPQRNGRMRLVGVEYVVPFAAWAGAQPPVLHGQEYHANETFGLWTLHVWMFKHNPAGMFADWNPTVTCAWAQ